MSTKFQGVRKIEDGVEFCVRSPKAQKVELCLFSEDEQNEKKYYEDCVWIVYKNYLETKKKEIADEYQSEIDMLKKYPQ